MIQIVMQSVALVICIPVGMVRAEDIHAMLRVY